MGETGKYKVSDLVKETGVARTTINDWLQRYAQYLTYQQVGKRKLYTERTLSILSEIATLRNEDKNSFEIEKALADKHPVKPEIATEEPAVADTETASKTPVQTATQAAAQPTADAQGYALIAKKQTDEIAQLLSEQLQNITHRLDELEYTGQQPTKSSSRGLILSLGLVVILFATGAFILWKYEQLTRENSSLRSKQEKIIGELNRKQLALQQNTQQLNSIAVSLDKNRKEYTQNVKKLQQEMKQRQAAFSAKVETMSTNAAKRHKAELLKLRNQFAAERLALLKKIEDTSTSTKEKSDIIRKLQEQNSKMTEALHKLSEQRPQTLKTEQKQVEQPTSKPVAQTELKTDEKTVNPGT